MLTTLRIENFAIVSLLELDFKEGMTAFTGETGAGKSIMIDALMLALGERADISVVRKGAEKCEVTACFTIDKNALPAQWLQEHDVDHDENEVLLRRIVYAEGRSKSYINGQPFPLQKVKEFSEMLVDIHGQHQHQTLLHHQTHRQQLDQYANHQPLLEEVNHLYQQCQTIKGQLQKLLNVQDVQAKVTLLQDQITELNLLAMQEGEMHVLHTDHMRLHHARTYIEHTNQLHDLLAHEDAPNILSHLNQALQLLASLPSEDSSIKNAQELMNGALIQCEEALDEVRRFFNHLQLDPERLQEVEARISTLHHAARKFQVDVNMLPQHCIALQKELESLLSIEQTQKHLQQQYLDSEKAYQEKAQRLHASRVKHAQVLAAAVTETIQQLGMPKGYITVEITPLDKIHAHGMDKVEYHVCTNPGMPKDTLAKVASGGELSRIGLAIQMITAERATTPTLLFDEVDVGIGGTTAALVGQLLRQLGERLQVFCVTHQPQVASMAHHHFRVEKHCHEEETFSQVVLLQQDEKVDEIARMLGGLTITEQTRSHARELLLQPA